MNYEEKRELRLAISQLLADAGLNQGTIKKIVETEIKNKVGRAVDQVFEGLNTQSSTGNYVGERIAKLVENNYINQHIFEKIVKDELKDRIIKVILCDVDKEERK